MRRRIVQAGLSDVFVLTVKVIGPMVEKRCVGSLRANMGGVFHIGDGGKPPGRGFFENGLYGFAKLACSDTG